MNRFGNRLSHVLLRARTGAVHFWTTLRQPDFPYRPGSDPMPHVVHSVFWAAFACVCASLVVLLGGLFRVSAVATSLGFRQVAPIDFFLRGVGAGALLYGVLGAVLVHGIWTERAYSQGLSIVGIAAAGVWVLVDMVRSREISLESIVATILACGAIRYLVANPDAVEYYRRLRQKGSNSSAVAEP